MRQNTPEHYIMQLHHMQALAKDFGFAKSKEEKSVIIGLALTDMSVCESFINAYKQGWLGNEGQFARILARILVCFD